MSKPLVGWGVSVMLGVCTALAGAAPAQAEVQYESQSQALLTFTPSDQTADRDISVRGQGSADGTLPSLNGNAADFSSLQSGGDPVTSQSATGNFDLQAISVPDRLLADLLLEFNSLYDNLVGGFLTPDRAPFCDLDTCFVVGRIEVAEPISVALLGVGLFGMAAARRRAQQAVPDRIRL